MDQPTRLVLASGSPRRHQLLGLLGIPHRVCPADIDESRNANEEAARFVLRIAGDKARAVAHLEPHLPVLAADTVVEVESEILGKPESPSEAATMLRRLSGRTHRVHTGVAIVVDRQCKTVIDSTNVRFKPLADELIRWYVATGEPLDKAGAYAVQGKGGLLVEGIDGSPHTVVGLPIHRLPELFEACGLDFWTMV